MKASIPALFCDDEDGCTEWIPDYYEMGVSNWLDFLDGWQHDPYRDHLDGTFCADHRTAETDPTTEGPST